MSQDERPTLWTRLAAALRGEVAGTTVAAYLRAGAGAYEDQLSAERLRNELANKGTTLWDAGPAAGSQLLCTWNAFVLHTLGNQLVEADYAHDPRTVGYLPPVTAEQAATFLGEVEVWSSRARRAAADPSYDLAEEVVLPAPLPGWVEVEPCPPAHLVAMLAAGRSLRDRTEAAQADFLRAGIPEDKQAQAGRLAGLIAEADSAVAYAESMSASPGAAGVHQRIEDSLKRAIGSYYLIGQLLAVPVLLDRPTTDTTAATAAAGAVGPLPGNLGFDPWCLTEPSSRARWKRDRAAREAVELLWSYDPDPGATLAIQAQIEDARAGGVITAAGSGAGTPGNYYCCPWAAIYLVRKPVVIAGRSLRPSQQFVFDVSAEDVFEGGRFRRELVLGPFHPTSEIDYCDPRNEGHRD